MPARASKGQLEDSYQRLLLNDFSGGLNTYIGAMALPSNTSPDMLNVLPLQGRLKYRGGYTLASALAYTADQAFEFYDTAGGHHLAVWANGNLYDCTTATPTLVIAACYTAGQRVGCCTQNGILYWSTWTVAIQYWNPTNITPTGAVTKTGVSDVPFSPYLFMYAGSIVALGVQYGAGATKQPLVMGWSVTNQPGNWTAASSQAVGEQVANATLEFGIVLGIANTGIPPTRTIVVGRSDKGIISYTGALGTLAENAINCPVGVADGGSAVFCPGADGFGDVIFLGSDRQFWKTNGVNAVIASLDIQNLVAAQVGYAPSGSRFFAAFNTEYSYYFCNVGSYQFVYKWDIKKWSIFSGWPNGPMVTTPDSNGVPSVFVASSDAAKLGFFQLAIYQGTDNGNPPPPIYYKTAWLHAGDPELLKIWHWLTLLAYATGTTYKLYAACQVRANDGSQMITEPVLLPTGGAGHQFILNQSLLNGSDVLASSIWPTLYGQDTPVMMRSRLACPVTWEEDSMCRGLIEETEGGGGKIYEDLKGVAVQFFIAYDSGTVDFDVLGIQTRFLARGYKREGGLEYGADMGVSNPHDSFMFNDLAPVDTAESS